jgi:hypothetical protein
MKGNGPKHERETIISFNEEQGTVLVKFGVKASLDFGLWEGYLDIAVLRSSLFA